MKTGLISGISAATLLLVSASAHAADSPAVSAKTAEAKGAHLNAGGPDRTSDYREPEYGPSMQPDANAYDWNDGVAFAAPDGSSYRYDGEWDGEYVDPQGRVFEGEWEGRVIREEGVSGPGYPAPKPHHAPPAHHAGAPHPELHHEGGHDVPRYQKPARGPYLPQGYSHEYGWRGGYYYYPQAPHVTVTIVPGASHTTTTVTEEIYYETVKSHARKKAVRKWKPRAKPRCVCR